MNEEREKKLAEWYGTGPFARPEAEPPACAQSVPPRSRHLGWKITGLCVLAVFVIAATALLFSSGVNALLPMLSEKLPPEGGQSMEEVLRGILRREPVRRVDEQHAPRRDRHGRRARAHSAACGGARSSSPRCMSAAAPSVVAITTVVETGQVPLGLRHHHDRRRLYPHEQPRARGRGQRHGDALGRQGV